jgi:hypothetical protein
MPRPRFARSSASRLTMVIWVQVDSLTTAPRPIRLRAGRVRQASFVPRLDQVQGAPLAHDSAERKARGPPSLPPRFHQRAYPGGIRRQRGWQADRGRAPTRTRGPDPSRAESDRTGESESDARTTRVGLRAGPSRIDSDLRTHPARRPSRRPLASRSDSAVHFVNRPTQVAGPWAQAGAPDRQRQRARLVRPPQPPPSSSQGPCGLTPSSSRSALAFFRAVVSLGLDVRSLRQIPAPRSIAA